MSLGAEPGVLYVVASPIGNLEDISLRALRILKEVHAVACEDTRETSKLLRYFEIKKPLISYHDFNERTRARDLINRLKSGDSIALLSDAGTPGISDPGYRLILSAIQEGIKITPVPGPSAVVAALMASGLPTDRFCFEGFLPEKSVALKKKIASLKNEPRTMIFFESTKRLKKTLENFLEILGDRKIVVARELTKKFETWMRGSVSDVIDKSQDLKGEVTLILAGDPAGIEHPQDMGELKKEVMRLVKNEGLSRKEAIRMVSEVGGVSRSDLYREIHLERNQSPE